MLSRAHQRCQEIAEVQVCGEMAVRGLCKQIPSSESGHHSELMFDRALGACAERLSSDVGHEREGSANRVTVAGQMRLNVASAAIFRASSWAVRACT